jgi:hypothetical protein
MRIVFTVARIKFQNSSRVFALRVNYNLKMAPQVEVMFDTGRWRRPLLIDLGNGNGSS